MKINQEKKDGTLRLALEGRLDTTTTPALEEVVNKELDGVTELIYDLKDLEYISSAGLRMLLASQKKMTAQGGTMVLINVQEQVNEVLEITGFLDILTVK